MEDEAPQSRYIIFADESGDHGLSNLRSHGRAFVIALAIFRRDEYERLAIPAVQDYKRRFFNDESAILHEREIRRGDGPFRRLSGTEERLQAEGELRQLLEDLPFSIAAVGIEKERFVEPSNRAGTPYDRRFIEALFACLAGIPEIREAAVPTEVVADSRGKKEDAHLRAAVRSVTESDDSEHAAFRFHVRFARKADVEVGVEVADLIANPIARRILSEEHPLVPFRLLESKFLKLNHETDGIALIVAGRG